MGFVLCALFIWVCCSSSLITEFPWCLESLILASGYTCPCCCLLLVLCWLVLPEEVILLEPCICVGWEKGMWQNRATAKELFKWSTTLQMKCVTPCDSISFTFQRMIQRLSASQTSRVKYVFYFFKKEDSCAFSLLDSSDVALIGKRYLLDLRLEKTIQQSSYKWEEEEWEERIFTSIMQSKSGSCKNIFHFNSVTMENTRLDEERKQEMKYVWTSGKHFYMITSFFFIIYLRNFVAENLKSLIFILALLLFFFEKCQSLFSPREKVNSWLSLGRSVVLFLLWIKLSFSLSCGSAYWNKEREKDDRNQLQASFKDQTSTFHI